MIIAYFWDRNVGTEFSILPLLGSMVLGLQRLLPAFQVGYSSWVNISTNLDSILNLIRLLDQPDKRTKLGRNILLVVITRKLSDNEFKIPLQGKYLNDVSNFKTDYNLQESGSATAANQIADNNKRIN